MKQAMTVHLFMSLEYPKHAKGHTDYSAGRVWTPEVWSVKVYDSAERVYVGAREVEIEVPENFNPIPQQVAALNAEKAEALEKYQQSVAAINERLSKLLAITNEVPA